MSGDYGGSPAGSSSNEDRPGTFKDDVREWLPIFGIAAVIIVVGLIVVAIVS